MDSLVITQRGTIGAARKKILLFRRYTLLPDFGYFGIDLSSGWEDNNKDFAIQFDGSGNKTAFIEDLYQINGDNQPPVTKIPVKFDAITTHLENANAPANETLINRKLFISFASGFGAGAGDTLTQKVSKNIHGVIPHKNIRTTRLWRSGTRSTM
jgi:hypothetical protein